MYYQGIPVVVSTSQPKYILPDEVIPGVPWPEGFKRSIDAWSRNYLGTYEIVADNVILMGRPERGSEVIYMNQKTFNKLKHHLSKTPY